MSNDAPNHDKAFRPQIGVISDCALQRHVLQNALSSYGLTIVLSCEPIRITEQQPERIDSVDCWILELDDEEFESAALDALISQEDTPVLFGLGKAPAKNDESYISWERRLFGKLEEHFGKMEICESSDSLIALDQQCLDAKPKSVSAEQRTVYKPAWAAEKNHNGNKKTSDKSTSRKHKKVANEIWVLAASLGGPAAVKAFLDELPENIQAGFLYAQHVDAHFSDVLTQVLGRHSAINLTHLQEKSQICEGEVLVVPVNNEVKFTEDDIQILATPWEGPYGPSIDHLLRNLLACYGQRCNVIVFSGMGNDGALLAPEMKRRGCSIWTQSPDSCANSSMPQSIIDLQCSELTASPEELAHALIARVGCSEEPSLEHLQIENLNRGT